MPAIKQPLLSVYPSIALLAIIAILLTACSDDPDTRASAGRGIPFLLDGLLAVW